MRPTWLYCVTCLPTGLMYVGITTTDPSKRWKKHVASSKNPRFKFQYAISQYGPSSFEVTPLFRYNCMSEACEAEIDLIAHLDLIASGLNAAPGGEISPMLDPAARNKLAAALVGRKRPPFSDEWRAKLAAAGRDRVHSPETRAKISAANKGRDFTKSHRDKISCAQRSIPASKRASYRTTKGRPLSADHKARIKEGLRRRKWTPTKEHLAKMVAASVAARRAKATSS